MSDDLDIQAPDSVYQALVDAHAELSEAESRQLMARLVLLLAARVQDPDAILAVVAEARTSVLEDR